MTAERESLIQKSFASAQSPQILDACCGGRMWWFTDESGIRRPPMWWFMVRFRLIAWRENRREDETIKAWATYDAAAQDVGRALYVAETMIHMEILEGRDPAKAVSRHLDEVRDKFAIPYAKARPGA